MKAGTKNKEVLAGIPAPPCFSQRHPPTPVSSEDYSLEPWGNSLLLVQTVLSVDPVSAYRRVRLTSQKTTKTGEASDFIFVFIFLNNEEWQ